MFKLPSLQLYRKFLVLGALLAGLFIFSSTSNVGATPCCDACLSTLNSCIAYCYQQEQYPGFDQCLEACGLNYDNCSRACGHGIPICPPM